MQPARLDLWPGDTVWLVPRTLTAPAVCFTQPRACVVVTEWPYLVVAVDGREYRVHADNVRRSDPNATEPPAAKPHVKARLMLPDGYVEQPLW